MASLPRALAWKGVADTGRPLLGSSGPRGDINLHGCWARPVGSRRPREDRGGGLGGKARGSCADLGGLACLETQVMEVPDGKAWHVGAGAVPAL